MAKTLVLLRHAKSAWPEGVTDHERPLSGRGRRDAPAVGRWLREQGIEPDLALVSGARRAVDTYRLVAAELPTRPRELVTDAAYHAGAGDLLDLVRDLPPEVATALTVGHNPAIGVLAGLLDAGGTGPLEFKTSAVAAFDVGASWADVNPGAGRLLASAVPRGGRG